MAFNADGGPETAFTLAEDRAADSEIPTVLRLVSKPEFEDWSLVLTTSRGQVKIAPVVPPTLKLKLR